MRWQRGTLDPTKCIVAADFICARCLNKWEKAHGVAMMLNGAPARSRVRQAKAPAA